MKRVKSKPEEVWLYQDKWGGWDFSFDPPLKRYESRTVRMVNAVKASKLHTEVRRLRKALRDILIQGAGCGHVEGDIAAAALRPRRGRK
jgi:hypothetical protein